MNCDDIRPNLSARRSGDLDPRNTDEVDAHLRGCASCAAEARDEHSALSLLQSIEELTPSPRVWDRLSKETRTRRRSFTLPVKIAAAAGILAAAFSFAFVATVLRPARVATVASVAPGSPIEPGYALRANERLVTPAFALLTLPDIGTLKLNRDTTIVFESPRRVRLERGELFADIRSDVRGFAVESGGTEIAVQGTRFGVRTGDLSMVYVVDGKVDVNGPAGKVTLTGHQMADSGGAARPLEDDALQWLARSESPVVALVAEAPQGYRFRPGDSLDLTVRFVTASPAPVLLPPLDDLLPLIRLNVTDAQGKPYLVRIPASALRNSTCRTRGPHGPVRLDVSTPCVLSLRVAPDLLPSSGRIRIRAAYQPARGGDFWDRELSSESLEFEVR
jgi:hypothetical protein